MTREIKLVDAALSLGKSYNATMRLVIVGELKGGRRDGRWYVDEEDLDRLKTSASENRSVADA